MDGTLEHDPESSYDAEKHVKRSSQSEDSYLDSAVSASQKSLTSLLTKGKRERNPGFEAAVEHSLSRQDRSVRLPRKFGLFEEIKQRKSSERLSDLQVENAQSSEFSASKLRKVISDSAELDRILEWENDDSEEKNDLSHQGFEDMDDFEDEISGGNKAVGNESIKVRVDKKALKGSESNRQDDEDMKKERLIRNAVFQGLRKLGVEMHKINLMCLMIRLWQRSSEVCDDSDIQKTIRDLFESTQTSAHKIKKEVDLQALKDLLSWFKMHLLGNETAMSPSSRLEATCVKGIECIRSKVKCYLINRSSARMPIGIELAVLLFCALCRSLGIQCRIVEQFSPIQHQPSKFKHLFEAAKFRQPFPPCQHCILEKDQDPSGIMIQDKATTDSLNNSKKRARFSSSSKHLRHSKRLSQKGKIAGSRSSCNVSEQVDIDSDHLSKELDDSASSSSSSSDDFKRHSRRNKKRKASDEFSACEPSDSILEQMKQFSQTWCEVYLEKENRWIHVDSFYGVVDKHRFCDPSKGSLNPICYFLSADRVLKDVSKRYANRWSYVLKKRIEQDWFEETLHYFNACYGKKISEQELSSLADDDRELERISNSESIPSKLDDFRNHPLFCIEKFCKKYEAIYPKHPILGKVGTHEVFPRNHLHTLHTEDRWIRHARQVRDGELPYKTIVNKSKRKPLGRFYDAEPEESLEEELRLFGEWQTDPWIPPKAEFGIVPRNERGNVDLWTEKHLPGGTVHLDLPRVSGIARKLGVDFAPAMVGFELKKGRWIPIIKGIVVCEEFSESIKAAHQEAEERRLARETKRKQEKAFDLWKRLFNGIVTRHRFLEKEKAKQLKEEAALEMAKSSMVVNSLHEHVFPEADRVYDQERNLSIDRCSICGLEIEFQEI